MSYGIPVHDCYAYRMALARPGQAPPTQTEIAHRAGISPHMYARVEQGRSNPSATTLRKIAKALRVSQAHLCTSPKDLL